MTDLPTTAKRTHPATATFLWQLRELDTLAGTPNRTELRRTLGIPHATLYSWLRGHDPKAIGSQNLPGIEQDEKLSALVSVLIEQVLRRRTQQTWSADYEKRWCELGAALRNAAVAYDRLSAQTPRLEQSCRSAADVASTYRLHMRKAWLLARSQSRYRPAQSITARTSARVRDGDRTSAAFLTLTYPAARAVTIFDRLLPATRESVGHGHATCVRNNEAADPAPGKSSYQIACTQLDGLTYTVFDYLTEHSSAQQLRDATGLERPPTTLLNGAYDHQAFYTVHQPPDPSSGLTNWRLRIGFAIPPWSQYTIEVTWPGHEVEDLVAWARQAPL